MEYGYEKMIGNASIQAIPNTYTFTSLLINQTKINAPSQFTIGLSISDSLTYQGLIII
jgi:hypothetical protein